MAVQRMDNVAVVVDDLDEAITWFETLGLVAGDRMMIEGEYADRTVGLDGLRSEIVMMSTPDGSGRLELTRYHVPDPVPTAPPAPNTIGLHRVMFAVDDLKATLESLHPLGAELLGEVADFESVFLLCYVRGPGGIIVGLAQSIG